MPDLLTAGVAGFFTAGWLAVDYRCGQRISSPRPFLLLLAALLPAFCSYHLLDERRDIFHESAARLSASVPQAHLFRVEGLPRVYGRFSELRLSSQDGFLPPKARLALWLPPIDFDDPHFPRSGDRLKLTASFAPPRSARHPFLGNYRRDRVFSGVMAEARLENLSSVTILAPGRGFLTTIDKARRALFAFIRESAGPGDGASLLQALILGCRGGMRPEIRQLFLDFGVFHLFAISGLHLAIVSGLMLFAFLRLLPWLIRPWWRWHVVSVASGLTLALLPFYIVLSGLQLPVIRAGIMAFFFLGGRILRRHSDSFNALAGAAVLTLAIWPEALFEMSFQLSYGAVLAIIWAYPLAVRAWERWFAHVPQAWRSPFVLFLVSLAINFFTAPVLINRVYFVSSYSLPANLLLVPLFSMFFLPLALGALLLMPLPFLAGILLRVDSLALDKLLEVMTTLAGFLPARRLYISSFSSTQLTLLYLVMITFALGLAGGRSRTFFRCLLPVLLLVLMIFLLPSPRSGLGVAAFVGGRPPTVLLEMPEREALLINGGGWSEGGFSAAVNLVEPYCRRRGIRRIPVIMLTQPTSGCVAGLLHLIEHFQVREIWYHGVWSGYPPFRDFNRVSQEKFAVRWRKLTDLSYPFSWSGVEVEVLGPPANDIPVAGNFRQVMHSLAPSLLLSQGDRRVMIWGGGALSPETLPSSELDVLVWLEELDEELDNEEMIPALPTSWWIHPGRGGHPRPSQAESSAQSWDLAADGFLLLCPRANAGFERLTPPELISGCQGGL